MRSRPSSTTSSRYERIRRQVDGFEALLDGEGAERVNPAASRAQQLTNIRAVYRAEKEALGALAIEIRLT